MIDKEIEKIGILFEIPLFEKMLGLHGESPLVTKRTSVQLRG